MSEYLPKEIAMKILVRLPPKPLIKFRCVSKSWYSMISSPHFISLHTQHALLLSNSTSPSNTIQMIVLGCYNKPRNIEIFSLDKSIMIEFPSLFDVCISNCNYRFIGSCNGLICFMLDQFRPSNSIQLWNLALKRKLKLPMPPAPPPEECRVVLGFGFDARNIDYKVVRICYFHGDCGYPTVEVYSLSRGSCHKVECATPRNCVIENALLWQVFLNGNVHWTAYKQIGKNNERENMIMSFDVSLEVFSEIHLPEALENECQKTLQVVDLGGSLAVVQYDQELLLLSKSCCIWVMKNYGDVQSWSMDYNVVFEGQIGMILGLRGNGAVLLTLVDESGNQALVSHSCVTGENVVIEQFGAKRSFCVGPYFECLALLDESNSHEECYFFILPS